MGGHHSLTSRIARRGYERIIRSTDDEESAWPSAPTDPTAIVRMAVRRRAGAEQAAAPSAIDRAATAGPGAGPAATATEVVRVAMRPGPVVLAAMRLDRIDPDVGVTARGSAMVLLAVSGRAATVRRARIDRGRGTPHRATPAPLETGTGRGSATAHRRAIGRARAGSGPGRGTAVPRASARRATRAGSAAQIVRAIAVALLLAGVRRVTAIVRGRLGTRPVLASVVAGTATARVATMSGHPATSVLGLAELPARAPAAMMSGRPASSADGLIAPSAAAVVPPLPIVAAEVAASAPTGSAAIVRAAAAASGRTARPGGVRRASALVGRTPSRRRGMTIRRSTSRSPGASSIRAPGSS